MAAAAAIMLRDLSLFISRSRKSRKADVNSGDKKIPNGILEEQGGDITFLSSFFVLHICTLAYVGNLSLSS